MTPLDLQDCLVKELKELFSGQLFKKYKNKTTDPDTTVSLNVYPQALPMSNGYKYSSYVPYITVQLKSGKHTEETESGELVVFLNICIYDDDDSNQGYCVTLDIIERIRQYLFKKRVIGGRYHVKMPYEWQLSDEEIWPVFVAVAETHWDLPLTALEDPYI